MMKYFKHKLHNSDDKSRCVLYVRSRQEYLPPKETKKTKKVKINEVVGAQQIVLDYSNNLYYYNTEKEVFVANKDGVKKIEGLPANPSYISLLKPPFVIDDGIPVVVDNKAYVVYVNGSSKITYFGFGEKHSVIFNTALITKAFINTIYWLKELKELKC